jgi:parallel beta-helix repeat protein
VFVVLKIKKIVIILFAIVLASQAIVYSASATTINVGSGKSIQSAVNSAKSGDTIIVNPGTYSGNISITKPNLTLTSSSPYNATINAKNNAFNMYASNITIKGFNIKGPGKSTSSTGINFVQNSFFCTIRNNKISNFNTGVDVGFYLYSGDESILNNEISNCGTGISAYDLMNRILIISGNKISGCNIGIKLDETSGNKITNNNFNNTVNFKSEDRNIFNTKKTSGTNIVRGPSLGGNYWATPDGKGFSQTHSDSNGDGFSEVPYKIDAVNVDYLPLIAPKVSSVPKAPVAAFSASRTSGKAPLKVTFADKSKGAVTSWKWNFGDGKYSTTKNSVHTYTKAGKYTVSLTVKNAKGSNTKTVKNYITVTK